MSSTFIDTIANNLQATQPQAAGPGASGAFEAMKGIAAMAQAMNDLQVAWSQLLNSVNIARQTNMQNMQAVLEFCMGNTAPTKDKNGNFNSVTVPNTNPPIVLANFPGGIGYWSAMLNGADSKKTSEYQGDLSAANAYYQNENTLYNTTDTAYSTMSNTSQTTLTGLSPAQQNLLANTKALIDLWNSISSMLSSATIG